MSFALRFLESTIGIKSKIEATRGFINVCILNFKLLWDHLLLYFIPDCLIIYTWHYLWQLIIRSAHRTAGIDLGVWMIEQFFIDIRVKRIVVIMIPLLHLCLSTTTSIDILMVIVLHFQRRGLWLSCIVLTWLTKLVFIRGYRSLSQCHIFLIDFIWYVSKYFFVIRILVGYNVVVLVLCLSHLRVF